MVATPGKKMLYRHLSDALSYHHSIAEIIKNKHSEGWRTIESDVMRVFGKDHLSAWIWFNTPAIALGGNRPVDMITSGHIESVRDLLVRLEYGVYT